MRKNIYVKDSDLPLFEWAEKEAGDSLSSILAEALRQFKQRKETEAKLAEQGYETLTVDLLRPGSDYTQTKQFEGKWIIGEFRSGDDGEQYSVAHTKHGRIVITRDDTGFYDIEVASDFKVFDDLKVLKAHNENARGEQRKQDLYPEDLINAIAMEFGEEHVEVLDI